MRNIFCMHSTEIQQAESKVILISEIYETRRKVKCKTKKPKENCWREH